MHVQSQRVGCILGRDGRAAVGVHILLQLLHSCWFATAGLSTPMPWFGICNQQAGKRVSLALASGAVCAHSAALSWQ